MEVNQLEKIKRTSAPKLVFEPTDTDWQPTGPEHQTSIIKALSHDIRRAIYEQLKDGPIRQSVLSQTISKKLKKKISNAHLRYHLKLLSDSGLVSFGVSQEGKSKMKMVYRSADLQVRLRTKEEPRVMPVGAPTTPEKFVTGIKHVLKGK